MKKEEILNVSLVVFLSLSVFYFVFAAWTEPSSTPPNGNVPAPLNVSTTPQTKTGDLTLPNLHLNAAGTEGDIDYIDELVGYNDLILRGDSSNTSLVYIEGKDVIINNDSGTGIVSISNSSPQAGSFNTKLYVEGDEDVRGQIMAKGGVGLEGAFLKSGPWFYGDMFLWQTANGATTCADDTYGGIGYNTWQDLNGQWWSSDPLNCYHSAILFDSGGIALLTGGVSGTTHNDSPIGHPPNMVLSVRRSGNVGVDVDPPQARLHVSGGNLLLEAPNGIQGMDSSGTIHNRLIFEPTQAGLVFNSPTPPTTSNDSCTQGEIRWGQDPSDLNYYIYICVSTDTWRRSFNPLTTF